MLVHFTRGAVSFRDVALCGPVQAGVAGDPYANTVGNNDIAPVAHFSSGQRTGKASSTTGKMERIAGTVFCNQTLKAKGIQKEQQAQAFAAQNAELSEAQRLEQEWNDAKLAPMVKSIVNDAAQYAKTKWNWDFVITSIYRTPAEDAALHASGIHVDWRAVDVRTRDETQQAIDDVADYINGKYAYDPARPRSKRTDRCT